MKIYTYLSNKFNAFGCTPLEIQVFKYLSAIEMSKIAKNNPRVFLPPKYEKLFKELGL